MVWLTSAIQHVCLKYLNSWLKERLISYTSLNYNFCILFHSESWPVLQENKSERCGGLCIGLLAWVQVPPNITVLCS